MISGSAKADVLGLGGTFAKLFLFIQPALATLEYYSLYTTPPY